VRTTKAIVAAAEAVAAAFAAAEADQQDAAEAASDAQEQAELDLAIVFDEGVAEERARLRELDEIAAGLGPTFAADFQRARYEAPSTAGEVLVVLLKAGRWQPGAVAVDELAERRTQRGGPNDAA
jgi:hypothetical protein